MKPAAFGYERPLTVDEAVAVLARHGGSARVLAGGQSLAPMLHMRLMQPAALVDINRIGELTAIEVVGDAVHVGALVRYGELERSALVAERLPLLREAVRHVGDRQVRNRGTIGGSLAHADPVGEMPLVCLALAATIVARSERGSREIPMGDFVLGPYTTTLEPDELIVEVRFPPAPSTFRFMEVTRRHNDFAVVALALVATRKGARWTDLRVAIAGGDDHPLLLDVGERSLAPDSIEGVVAECLELIDPISDVRASDEYRAHLITTHLRRMLQELG